MSTVSYSTAEDRANSSRSKIISSMSEIVAEDDSGDDEFAAAVVNSVGAIAIYWGDCIRQLAAALESRRS